MSSAAFLLNHNSPPQEKLVCLTLTISKLYDYHVLGSRLLRGECVQQSGDWRAPFRDFLLVKGIISQAS